MSADTVHGRAAHHIAAPDTTYSVRELFGIDSDLMVPGFSEASIIPKQSAAVGLSKTELISRIIEQTLLA